MKPEEFFAAIAPAAVASMHETGIPASFTLAQAALESRWGASQLATVGFNLFGVKADKSWTGPTMALPTKEQDKGGHESTVTARWRVYPNWLACINDHAQFFIKNPRYDKAFPCTTGEAFAHAIADAGYATDINYGKKLVSIIGHHQLHQYDKG